MTPVHCSPFGLKRRGLRRDQRDGGTLKLILGIKMESLEYVLRYIMLNYGWLTINI